MIVTEMRQTFLDLFHALPEKAFFAPGRMNLIGEHTDYNGGHVFPCALTCGTYAMVKKCVDPIIRLYSANFPEKGIIQFALSDLHYEKAHGWANYPKGMLRSIVEAGYDISGGFDAVIEGNIPHSSGLSSSASLEILTGVMVKSLFGFEIPCLELSKMAQRAENEFIGVESGIMDPFAVCMGKKDSAILLNCQTLTYEYAPIHLNRYKIIIMNTNKPRELVESKYNERRSECMEALAALQKKLSIPSLGQLSEEEFAKYQQLLSSETSRKRARHAVTENRRTLKAFKELKAGNLKAFGELLNQSHNSLRDDYEVTGKELDSLVEAAWKHTGVLGARMTGAGFGGCAIAIVDSQETERFIADVGAAYHREIGWAADFFSAEIGDGAKEIEAI